MPGKRKVQDRVKTYAAVTVLFLLVSGISTYAQQISAAAPLKLDKSQTIPTVAVFDFSQDGPRGSPNFPNFSEWISLLLLEYFQKQGSIEIVERKKLAEVMAELNLGSSMIADLPTKLRLGRLLGADYFVFGSYLVAGDLFLISAYLVSIRSGLIVKAADIDGDKSQLETMVNRLAIKLLDGFRAASGSGGR